MLEQMSEPLIQAVLAAEDRRFYEHNGVDLRRISAAMIANFRRGRIVQGASTITQQLVRAAVLDRAKTYSRKFREAWLSHRLEEKFGKSAILQAYLNHVYFGEGNYGVQAASLGYFGKPAVRNQCRRRRDARVADQSAVGLGDSQEPGEDSRSPRLGAARDVSGRRYLDATTFGKAIATPVASTLASERRPREAGSGAASRPVLISRASCTTSCSNSSASIAR